MSLAQFHQYTLLSRPVVVRKGAKDWPIRTKWTRQYLDQTSGDSMVAVKVSAHNVFNADDHMQHRQMRLRQFLNEYHPNEQ